MASLLKVLVILAVLAGAGWGTLHWTRTQEAKKEANSAQAAPGSKAPAGKGGAPAAGPGGQKPGGGGGPAGPMAVDVFVVKTEPMEATIPAVGSLAPNESVAITSEQTLRIRSILFEEGDTVAEGQVLFELDDTELQQDLREREVRRDLAKIDEERLRSLLADQAISQSDYDTAKYELDGLNVQIDRLKTDIAKTRIAAPFAGRVGIRQVSNGALVSPNMTLTTLQDSTRVKVDLKVPERYAGSIKAGANFRFRTENTTNWTEAEVLTVEPAIEKETRSLIVRGVAENADGHLVPGSFVRAEIPTRLIEDAVLIPSEAISPSIDGAIVYVAEEGKARRRDIEIGVRLSDRVQISNGLKGGDAVIVSNLLRLRPGIDVVAKPINP